MTGLIDAHAHIGDAAFDGDRAEVLERARQRGLRGVVVVSETLAEARRCLKLAGVHHGFLWPCAGLYPTHLSFQQAEELIRFTRRHRAELIAIGEVGLDHWVVKEEQDRATQKQILQRFVELSCELGLPLNVHSRSAGRETIELLRERGARRALLHAFDGRAAVALRGVEAGYFFSIPPSIVRSRQKQKLVRQLPLENILLETDSPVLGPDPTERNEPANLFVALEAVAEIKGVDQEEVVKAVVRNQHRLFGDIYYRLEP